MKILFLNWRDRKNPKAGGAEVVTEEIAKRLVEKGHQVILLTSKFKGCQNEEIVDGYKIIRKGKEYTIHFWAFVYWLKKFRKENFDLIIDQIHGIPFFTPLYIRKVKKIAFIHEVAKEIWLKMYSFPFSKMGYLLEPLFYKFYKNIPFITVSQSTKKDLISVGIPEKNISIIPEAITASPLEKLPEKEKDSTIIFVGRICKMKGIGDLIKAYFIAKKQIPNLKLWLIGNQLENYKVQNRKSKDIKFFSYVSEDEKNKLMSRAWVLSSASMKEGFGLVVIEAAAMATPSVVYNVDGFKDSVLDNKTGILCQKNTPNNLSKNMIELIKDKDLYQKFQKNGLEYSKGFNFDRMTKEFEKCL